MSKRGPYRRARCARGVRYVNLSRTVPQRNVVPRAADRLAARKDELACRRHAQRAAHRHTVRDIQTVILMNCHIIIVQLLLYNNITSVLQLQN